MITFRVRLIDKEFISHSPTAIVERMAEADWGAAWSGPHWRTYVETLQDGVVVEEWSIHTESQSCQGKYIPLPNTLAMARLLHYMYMELKEKNEP